MDPLGDLFPFQTNNDLKEEIEVQDFLKDIDESIRSKKRTGEQKPRKKFLKIECQLCEEGEVHEECTQKRKSQRWKTESKYACDKCDYIVDRKELLRNHIEAVHLKIKIFRCSSCSHETYLKKVLRLHIKSKHKNESCRLIKIGCSPCETNQSHEFCEKRWTAKKWKTDRKYSCDECEYTSDQKHNVKNHMETVHLNLKRFRCSACVHTTYERRAILLHIKKHRDEQCRYFIIGCPLCERKENHKMCVKQPLTQSQHGKFKCTECYFTSNQQQSLIIHKEAVHLKIKKFYCKSCNHQAYHKPNLIRHIKLNHKSAFYLFGRMGCESCKNDDNLNGCNDCDFIVNGLKAEIKTHLKTEKKKRKKPKDICKIKPKTTKNNKEKAPTLKSTFLLCLDCKDSFGSIESLKDHESNSHSDIGRFACNLCDYMCYFKLLLTEHQKDMHEDLASRVIKIGCEECEENIEHKCDLENDVLNKADLGKTGKIEEKKDASLAHSATLNDKLSCLMCDFSSDDKGIILHTQRVHLKLLRYECVECGYRAFYRKSLKGHMKSKHGQESLSSTFLDLNCTLCTKEVDHEEHQYTKTENKDESKKFRKIKKKKKRKTYELKEKGIKSESEKPEKMNGKLRSKGNHKCTEKNCEFATDYKPSLKAHVESRHNGTLKFKCSMCDYKNYYKHLVAYHQKTSSHSDKKNKVLRIGCTFCEEDIFHTQHSNQITKNRKIRKGIKGMLKCLVPDCTYMTDVKMNLTAHNNWSHKDRNCYSCNLCTFKGSCTGRVKLHQANIHRDEKAKVVAIGCKDCQENIEHKKHTFPAKPYDYGHCLLCKDGVEHSEHEYTKMHSNGKKGGERERYKSRTPVECSICGIKLRNGKFQVKHYQKEHPSDKIFNCRDCNYATNFLPNLNTHVSSMHEKKVRQCSLCSYNTTWNTSFLEHMRSAHGLFQKKSKHSVECEANPILCDDCGFSTFNQKQFNAHKLAACKSLPFLQYDTKFKSHMRYNSSLKLKSQTRHSSPTGFILGNFKCNQCVFSSDKPTEIRDHVQKNHAGRDDNKFKFSKLTSNQDIKFKCNKCKFQASEPTHLRDHMSAHD